MNLAATIVILARHAAPRPEFLAARRRADRVPRLRAAASRPPLPPFGGPHERRCRPPRTETSPVRVDFAYRQLSWSPHVKLAALAVVVVLAACCARGRRLPATSRWASPTAGARTSSHPRSSSRPRCAARAAPARPAALGRQPRRRAARPPTRPIPPIRRTTGAATTHRARGGRRGSRARLLDLRDAPVGERRSLPTRAPKRPPTSENFSFAAARALRRRVHRGTERCFRACATGRRGTSRTCRSASFHSGSVCAATG